jgi:hypothetical protein
MPDPRYTGWTRNTEVLKPHQYKPVWNDKITKTIRVPVALADSILAYARALDSGEVPPDNIKAALTTILTKVESKAPGYRANSASQLIKDLRELCQ